MTTSPYAQTGHRIRMDWGVAGADAVGDGVAVVAVIDVLSFSTTLTVAVENGIAVLPYRWRDASAGDVARRHGATLAVGRAAATGPDQISLSPVTVRAARGITRLVLPSPNGATIADRLAGRGATVIGVCLRNAAAAAAWTRAQVRDRPDAAVAVIAAGERWPDGSLRPAAEDLWGAGAFIAGLTGLGRSPEAEIAAAAYAAAAGRLPALLDDCAGGRELIGYGFAEDVAVAAECDASDVVPVLDDGWFVTAAPAP